MAPGLRCTATPFTGPDPASEGRTADTANHWRALIAPLRRSRGPSCVCSGFRTPLPNLSTRAPQLTPFTEGGLVLRTAVLLVHRRRRVRRKTSAADGVPAARVRWSIRTAERVLRGHPALDEVARRGVQRAGVPAQNVDSVPAVVDADQPGAVTELLAQHLPAHVRGRCVPAVLQEQYVARAFGADLRRRFGGGVRPEGAGCDVGGGGAVQRVALTVLGDAPPVGVDVLGPLDVVAGDGEEHGQGVVGR